MAYIFAIPEKLLTTETLSYSYESWNTIFSKHCVSSSYLIFPVYSICIPQGWRHEHHWSTCSQRNCHGNLRTQSNSFLMQPSDDHFEQMVLLGPWYNYKDIRYLSIYLSIYISLPRWIHHLKIASIIIWHNKDKECKHTYSIWKLFVISSTITGYEQNQCSSI